MKELSLRELQLVELSILKKVHSLCVENDIRYSICGGTLLGAVRHKGFIPWDDDIDIIMPRPDYEKFLKIARSVTNLNVMDYLSHPNLGKNYAKICDDDYYLVEFECQKYSVFIDVFPIDGLGQSYEDAKKIIDNLENDRRLVAFNLAKVFSVNENYPWYLQPIRYILYCYSKILSVNKLLNRINLNMQHFSFEESMFAGCAVGLYKYNEIFLKELFSQLELIEFEGEQFYAVKNYELYLKQLYGNYMVMPPEDKRITHHTIKAYHKSVNDYHSFL